MNNLLAKINSGEGEIVKLTCDLVKQKTVNPPGDEYKAAKVVEDFLKKEGIKYEVYEKIKGRPNIIAKIGNSKGKKILVAAHLDVVPAGDNWSFDAFKPFVKDKRIYGRGVSDNKASLACLMFLAKLLKNEKLKGQIILAALSDEEIGSDNGLKYMLEKNLIKADFAIIPDMASNLKKISVGEKGIIDLKIISIGKQAHGSRPQYGVNAVYMMNKLISLIEKYQLKHKKSRYFSKPTINLGMINGGSAPNTVPGKCEITLNIRYLPNQNSAEIIKEIEVIVKKVKKKNPKAEFNIIKVRDDCGYLLGKDYSFVQILEKNTRFITTKNPKVVGASGGSFARYLSLSNIPAINFGPGDNELTHASNESISIKELVDFTKIMALTVLEILK